MCQVLAKAVVDAESDESAANFDAVFVEIFSGPRAPFTEAVRERLGQGGQDEVNGGATILPGPGAWDRPGASDRGGEHVRPPTARSARDERQ
eukprot:11844002-Heterocapsa_arctica.AAC.1